MTEAFICDAVRPLRGKASPKGGLFDYAPTQLLVRLHEEIRARSGLDPGAVDDVIIGCASQNDEQGANIAKTSALLGGWGDNVPGMTVNRFCASGIEAVNLAAARVKSDGAGVLLAGGVESIFHVPMYSDNGPLFCDPATVDAIGSVEMGIAADIVATIEGFERPELDAFGVSTQTKAAAAWAQQRFARSVVPMERRGREPFAHDEHIRADTTYEALAAQQPLFAEIGLGGQDDRDRSRLSDLGEIRHLHTRGTSPSLADAAGLLVVASGEAAAKFGLRPRARIVASERLRRPGHNADRGAARRREPPRQAGAAPGRHRRLRVRRGLCRAVPAVPARPRRRRRPLQPQRRHDRHGALLRRNRCDPDDGSRRLTRTSPRPSRCHRRQWGGWPRLRSARRTRRRVNRRVRSH